MREGGKFRLLAQENCHSVSPVASFRSPVFVKMSRWFQSSLIMCPWLVLTPYLRPTRVVVDSPRIAWEDPLEKEMVTLSGTLAWKIPWTEERGRLQSMGLQRVGHD